MLNNTRKHISSFFGRVVEFCNDWLDVIMVLKRNPDGEALQVVSLRYFLAYGAVMAIVGMVVSYTFYWSALLKDQADFSAKMLQVGSKEVAFSLESDEAIYSQEVRIQTKRVGQIAGLTKDGVPVKISPVYNLAIYSPDIRLILDGRRMLSHTKFTFQVAVMATDSEEVLLEEGWEPSAPGSRSVLFALQEVSKEVR